MGTSAGSKVFVEHGWRPAAALALGWEVWCLFILFMRGPNAGRYTWIGWEGGWKARKEKEEGSEIKSSEEDLESGSQSTGGEKSAQDQEETISTEQRQSAEEHPRSACEPQLEVTTEKREDTKRTES